MAEFNTPVGVHFWRQVTEGVSRFVAFVDNTWALDTSKVKWATTLNTLNVKLPATPSKTTAETAKKIWDTLLQVESELDEWSETNEIKDIEKAYIFITACKSRGKAFGLYRTAFTAFYGGGQCKLCKYLAITFPANAPRICMCLGALEEEHLTFIDVEKDFTSLSFLTHPQKCILADIVRGVPKKNKPNKQLEKEQPKPAQCADPPRKPLVVVLSDSKAQLEYMRACLLGV